MNKAELVTAIAHTCGQNKVEAHSTVAATLHVLTAALAKGERITLIGFGTFERRQRQARVGVNPRNPKQKLKIPASKVPVFRAGQELKNIVDGKAKLPTLTLSAHPSKSIKKSVSKPVKNKAKGKTKKSR